MKKIAIIGAGPMGLAVAYELINQGHRPIIYEADDRIGGMTASFDFDGLAIERFYHFHCISDDAFLQLLDELDVSQKMHWAETKMGFWFDGKIQQWGNPIALLKFSGLSLTAKLRYGIHAFISTKRNNWQSLDNLEASQWIKKWVGKEAWDVLWEKLFAYKFYNYSESLSAAWIWSRIRRIGRSRFNIFREKLGYLEGGSQTLLNALKSYILQNGGEIHLKSAISKVEINTRHVSGLHVDKKFEEFDFVVSTMPIVYIPRIIPDLPPEILSKYNVDIK